MWQPGDKKEKRTYSTKLSSAVLSTCAQNISILSEDQQNKDAISTAQNLVYKADLICYLGFGYHKENLDKLMVRNLTMPMIGTAFDLGSAERETITNFFGELNNKPKLMLGHTNMSNLAFLKEYFKLESAI